MDVLFAHQPTCSHHPINCNFQDNGCDAVMPYHMLENHVKECVWRPAICCHRKCDIETPVCHLAGHELTCQVSSTCYFFFFSHPTFFFSCFFFFSHCFFFSSSGVQQDATFVRRTTSVVTSVSIYETLVPCHSCLVNGATSWSYEKS
jgi:hypothetical protein